MLTYRHELSSYLIMKIGISIVKEKNMCFS